MASDAMPNVKVLVKSAAVSIAAAGSSNSSFGATSALT
jgi:hypothetical protein